MAPIVNEKVFQHHAFGQKERKAFPLVQEREQSQFFAEFRMVAFLRLFQHGEIRVHLVLFRKSGAVDTREHFIFFVAAPVSARNTGEFKRLDLARARKMRPAAEVGETPLFVERDLRVLGKVFNEFDLILFRIFGHEFDRLRAGQRKAFQGKIALDDLFHFLFDLAEVLLRDGRGKIDIVIKSVFDGRPDRKFTGREDRFDRLREHMRRSVTIHFQPLFIFERDDLEFAVAIDDGAQVHERAVHLRADRRAGKPLADGKRVNKATAINSILDEWKLDKNEIIAFGDSNNDLEMLDYVGVGVAMGNASDNVKNQSDYVTLDNDSSNMWI